MLTYALWHIKHPPFTWVEASDPAWTDVHREMTAKWLDAHNTGWCYFDGIKTYVFGTPVDATAFQEWIATNPFAGTRGEFGPGIVRPEPEGPPP